MIWATGAVSPSGAISQHSSTSRGSVGIDWTGAGAPAPPSQGGSGASSSRQFTAGFGVAWRVDGTAMEITVSCTSGSWCSLGLGGGMVNSDVVMCWFSAARGTVACDDAHVGGQKVTPSNNENQDVTVVSSTADANGRWSAVYRRALQTGDPNDKNFDLGGPQSVIWGTGPLVGEAWGEHSAKGSAQIDWGADGDAPQAAASTPVDDGGLTEVHSGFRLGVRQGQAVFAARPGSVSLGGARRGEVLAIADVLRFTFSCDKGQYCAVGLNDDGKMTPADAFICWEDNAVVQCLDWFCTQHSACPADNSQDVQVESYSSGASSWSVTFVRAISTGDAQDTVIPSGVVDMIYASGPDSGPSSPSQLHDEFGTAAYDPVTGEITVNSGGSGQAWHIIVAVVLLFCLGLIAGALILAKRSLGYLFQTSWLGAVLSSIFVVASFLVLGLGDYSFYKGRPADIATLFGGPAQLCMALALVLKARLFSPVLFLMKLPQERALWWHRWIGRLGWAFATLHALCMLYAYDNDAGKSIDQLFEGTLPTGGTTDGVRKVKPLSGFFAWLLYTALVLLGIPMLRRRFYEAFLYSHILISIATLICVIVHLPFGWRSYFIFGVPILILIVDNIARLLQRSKECVVESFETCGSITKIIIKPSSKAPEWGLGSYFFVTIPEIAFNEAHPFSVTSHHSSGVAVFYVKNSGSGTWTEKLSRLDRPAQGMKARMEGPYGRLCFDWRAHDYLVLIAGGVGITPMLSIADYLDPTQTATIAWSVRDPEFIRLIAGHVENLLSRFKYLRLVMFYTGATPLSTVDVDHPGITVVAGRPDYPALFAKSTSDRTAVAICGPPGLVEQASRDAKQCLNDAPVHIETFEF
eukprot:gene8885-13773_t